MLNYTFFGRLVQGLARQTDEWLDARRGISQGRASMYSALQQEAAHLRVQTKRLEELSQRAFLELHG